mmetsp:Transcript_79211/g.164400  ORF Transcript_79211/g.164400 Transcript_79211/m.164400 type:complete len:734 (+) Transcript_79211:220-2421(+)|eukprot:CAMPEP_0206424118 /NCGR_PEP_ID=MMETSP0324_2-20121206/3051_1 /ASSEMBLY_ACC=CAM_ASM_000836 /TAXON_ID=2866 /ORGANISM="Crypthecodinium cohnii, Strain Seligo" /LENGTH=733 /DNA_ID=CAMNT_0053888739 /DNA_START=134 /DNA_END=2335 /DNA_ORIENTATION=-
MAPRAASKHFRRYTTASPALLGFFLVGAPAVAASIFSPDASCEGGACEAPEESTLLQVNSRKATEIVEVDTSLGKSAAKIAKTDSKSPRKLAEINRQIPPKRPISDQLEKTVPKRHDDSMPVFERDVVNTLLEGVGTATRLNGNAGKPTPLPAPGCQVKVLDCSNQTKRKECPESCEAQDELIAVLGGSSGADAAKARNSVCARLQSLAEMHAQEMSAQGRSTGVDLGNFHQAILALDTGLKNLEKNQTREAALAGVHNSDIGYPLTVIEAYLAQWDLIDELVGIQRNSTNMKNYMEWVEVMNKYGWDSDEATAFFDAAIYLGGEVGLPGDAGWVNSIIANIRVITEDANLHMYRQVPYSYWPWSWGYDFDYSVYELPDDSDLKIGLLADWGSGTPQAIKVAQELNKQNVSMVIHLGDVYYSGTVQEARKFFLEPMRAIFGESLHILNLPGNHDYYDGGKGFYDVIDALGVQEASFFCLRGKHFQILAVDTGLLDSFDLLFSFGVEEIDNLTQHTMTFLPDDQVAWAQHQMQVGKEKGLRTILMSHHQLFSRASSPGVPNGDLSEAATMPDRVYGTYAASEFSTRAADLPGGLGDGVESTVNTRLLHQFPPEALKDVAAWFWGHEHTSMIFEPYAGLERGRCIGNGAIGDNVEADYFGTDDSLETGPWGGFPEIIPGSEIQHGDNFWGLGFATMTLSGKQATVDYFQLLDSKTPDGPGIVWGNATKYFTETFE